MTVIRAIRSNSVPQRRRDREDLGRGIRSYGLDNFYPQIILQRLYASGNTTNAVEKTTKFVKGDGFLSPSIARAKCNQRQTFNQLLSEIAWSLTVFRGFALHLNFNLLGQVTSIHHVPFEYCRIGEGEHDGQIAVFKDWAGEYYKNLPLSEIDYIDQWSPGFAAWEIEDLTAYKGQIYYYSEDFGGYPAASFDPIVEEVETDARMKNYNLNVVKSGFSASHILEYPGRIETKEDEKRISEAVEPNMGDEGAGSIMVVENPGGDTTPLRLHNVALADRDKMYLTTKEAVKSAIYNMYDIPPVLRGDERSGLFNQEQMVDAYTYFNEITKASRETIEEVLNEILPFYVRRFSDVRIKPKQFGQESAGSLTTDI